MYHKSGPWVQDFLRKKELIGILDSHCGGGCTLQPTIKHVVRVSYGRVSPRSEWSEVSYKRLLDFLSETDISLAIFSDDEFFLYA